MMKLFYFSGAGHSFTVAQHISGMLNCDMFNMDESNNDNTGCKTAVVVFPVYCQNIPRNVKTFLKSLNADYVALVATYGGISYGNVLYEAQHIVKGIVIAGASIPTGHTFLNGSSDFEMNQLKRLIERVENPIKVTLPKQRKNILADFFPEWRSRISVKIKLSEKCTGCNYCGDCCPSGAIKQGVINSSCMRCMKCVIKCPHDALSYKNSFFLNCYLKFKRKEKHTELFF